MSQDEKLIYEISYLTVSSLNGTISEEEFTKLEEILKRHPEAVDYYLDVLWSHINMNTMQGISSLEENAEDCDTQVFIREMLANETQAPAVEDEAGNIQQISIENEVTKSPSKSSKFFTLFNGIVSLAAVVLVFFIIYANIYPPQYSVPVATLVDQVNVVWDSNSDGIEINERIKINQPPYKIDKGIVKILYDNKVEVIIEGPAEFAIEKKGIDFISGRLYSSVPSSGHGFAVDTPNARFIDLGTEFGVFVGSNESSELHVIKGEVQYYSSFPDSDSICRNLKENHARRFNANNNEIQAIPLAEEYFVREIDSDAGVIWRGQKKMDLSDIVGGGNGFGTGQLNCVIEASTGMLKSLKHEELRFKARQGDSKYHISQAIRYVDGVFVPDGSSQINSNGYIFREFPDTSGLYSCDLLYGTLSEFARSFVLENIEYGTNRNHSIFMHANLGVTYDLEAIRNDLPGVEIRRFCAKGGISESANGLDLAGVDIWIFVDNQLVYGKQNVEGGQIENVNVELPENAKFLTIAVTEGSPINAEIYDKKRGRNVKPTNIYSDWFLWAEPVLIFE